MYEEENKTSSNFREGCFRYKLFLLLPKEKINGKDVTSKTRSLLLDKNRAPALLLRLQKFGRRSIKLYECQVCDWLMMYKEYLKFQSSFLAEIQLFELLIPNEEQRRI